MWFLAKTERPQCLQAGMEEIGRLHAVSERNRLIQVGTEDLGVLQDRDGGSAVLAEVQKTRGSSEWTQLLHESGPSLEPPSSFRSSPSMESSSPYLTSQHKPASSLHLRLALV